jgi:hypothetical protein
MRKVKSFCVEVPLKMGVEKLFVLLMVDETTGVYFRKVAPED